ncbi:MAG: hypothetical protein OER77_03700 [Myxococcales bacterium]|nr:hypothetical protein [Myxococcales bacterium]
MKTIRAALGVFAIGLALLSPVSELGPDEVGASGCYEIYGKSRNLGRGWAHIVIVENDCEYWLQCTVWTDVNPRPPAMLTVGPDMSEQAQITSDSEQQEFKALGSCRRK